MERERQRRRFVSPYVEDRSRTDSEPPSPGKRTLTEALVFAQDHTAQPASPRSETTSMPHAATRATLASASHPPIQRLFGGHLPRGGGDEVSAMQGAAARGIGAPVSALPHRDRIAAAF